MIIRKRRKDNAGTANYRFDTLRHLETRRPIRLTIATLAANTTASLPLQHLRLPTRRPRNDHIGHIYKKPIFHYSRYRTDLLVQTGRISDRTKRTIEYIMLII